ncbi:truncated IS1536 transposase [Mycobacterium tuberculosis]|nr:truncated IS1536 transposase [Mycobacterium tuberculosis]
MPRLEIPNGWCVQAFRFTLDPTAEQAHALARHFGARRKAYNWTVAQLKAISKRGARPAPRRRSRRFGYCGNAGTR